MGRFATMPTNQRQEIRVAWKCPHVSMVRLNVDKASRGNPGLAGCGCGIRDHEGHWLTGAARSLDICSAYHVECFVGALSRVGAGLQSCADGDGFVTGSAASHISC